MICLGKSFAANAECKLHNQTMTITHIAEL